MTSYNEYYLQENYFGNPYPELLNYFKNLDKKLKVLDVGCGQGRDVIALGRLGFQVDGIDLSEVGIHQLNEVASKEGLNVKGVVGDLSECKNMGSYDIVLMNSMFHFYKKDIEKETQLLLRILHEIKINGRLVLIVQENSKRIKHIKDTIQMSTDSFIINLEESFIYKEFNSRFYMISVQKSAG